MASEKLDVTATTDSYIQEGREGNDAELQARDFNLSPADAARRGMLEVRLLNYDGNKRDKANRAPAEVHQTIVDYLLQRHPCQLMGIGVHHLPIRAA